MFTGSVMTTDKSIESIMIAYDKAWQELELVCYNCTEINIFSFELGVQISSVRFQKMDRLKRLDIFLEMEMERWEEVIISDGQCFD